MSSNDYNTKVFKIKPLPEFNAWLEGLKDRQTQFRLGVD